MERYRPVKQHEIVVSTEAYPEIGDSGMGAEANRDQVADDIDDVLGSVDRVLEAEAGVAKLEEAHQEAI